MFVNKPGERIKFSSKILTTLGYISNKFTPHILFTQSESVCIIVHLVYAKGTPLFGSGLAHTPTTIP